MKKQRLILALLVGCLSLSTMSCAATRTTTNTPTVLVVKQRPPALRAETRPARPSQVHVWVSGHWTWTRNAYRWEKGYWIKPPHRRAVWVPAQWKKQRGGWIYVKGYWRTSR